MGFIAQKKEKKKIKKKSHWTSPSYISSIFYSTKLYTRVTF